VRLAGNVGDDFPAGAIIARFAEVPSLRVVHWLYFARSVVGDGEWDVVAGVFARAAGHGAPATGASTFVDDKHVTF
ncbi:MAG: hypothetical protein ABIP48_04240, partial [Planctomycetota bacterium]